ncbi:MAG TPA: response regulator transcription factor [Terriglobia bacterium]|nr:response regulator transcription factor [Terriglobia bacterium]
MSPENRERIRVLIVDEHQVFREGIRHLLESHAGMEVVGEVGDCSSAVSLVAREHPDVILIGLDMGPGQDAIGCFPQLRAAAHNARILVLTGTRDLGIQKRAIRSGAVGIVHKTQDTKTVIKAIEKVYAGEAWLDHKLTASLLSEVSYTNQKKDPHPKEVRLASLTKREREIVIYLRDGFKTREIADRLCISTNTVRNHKVSIYNKLGISNRLDLTLFLAQTPLAKSLR